MKETLSKIVMRADKGLKEGKGRLFTYNEIFMTNKTREQVIEILARQLCKSEGWVWDNLQIVADHYYDAKTQSDYLKEAAKLAALYETLGYVQKAEDQSLPEPSIYVPGESECKTNEVNLISRHYYLTAQQDMRKAGWIKVKTGVEMK